MPEFYVEDGLEISYVPDELLSDEQISAKTLTRAAYRQMRAERVERERHAPKPGDLAPDFEPEQLSPEGKRTGDLVRLSQSKGRPVALIFGSYT